jgi:hypothetical protein
MLTNPSDSENMENRGEMSNECIGRIMKKSVICGGGLRAMSEN